MAALSSTPRMDEYRREQAALGGRVAASASEIVSEGLDVGDPERGWPSMLSRLLLLIQGGRDVSEDLAMDFYRYLREIEDAQGAPPEDPEVPFPTAEVARSMAYTGPRLAKAMIKRRDAKRLTSRVGVMVGRSAMRHTLNGGRAAMTSAAVMDPAAWGWARVTDANPCKFCAMLAGRGPVYKSSRTAGALDQWHDGCACTVIAVFKGTPAAPKRTRSTRGADGMTDRQRAVVERVRREVAAERGSNG